MRELSINNVAVTFDNIYRYLSPTNKVHLTERMIADHMRELSINNIAVQSVNDKIHTYNPGLTHLSHVMRKLP